MSDHDIKTCEVLIATGAHAERLIQCGEVATHRYPAMGGSYMHLCAKHGAKHADYCDRLIDGRWMRFVQEELR